MEANLSRMISLNGSNYNTWKVRMEDLLYLNNFHSPVFTTKKPEDISEEQWRLLHRKVCAFIRLWVDDNVLNLIASETHAQTIWNKLENLYAPETKYDKFFLMKKLISLRYREGTPLKDHLNRFQGIINQLAGMGIKLDDEIQGARLLDTLPDSWVTSKSRILNEERERESHMGHLSN